MSRAIFLTPEEADKVRGFSPLVEGHALIPVATADGRFMVGAGVLDDPAYEHVRGFLTGLPQGEPVPAKERTEEEIAADEPSKLTVWTEERLEAAVVVLADEGATLDGLKGR